MQQVITEIPKKETYLEGIAAASPIVNSVVISVQDQLDKIQIVITDLRSVFDRKIELDFAGLRANLVKLKKIQENTMHDASILLEILRGPRTDLDSLLIRDNSLRQFFPMMRRLPGLTINGFDIFLLLFFITKPRACILSYQFLYLLA